MRGAAVPLASCHLILACLLACLLLEGFAHRDLKSANVLYNKEDMRAKVTDFGMSRSLHEPALIRGLCHINTWPVDGKVLE